MILSWLLNDYQGYLKCRSEAHKNNAILNGFMSLFFLSKKYFNDKLLSTKTYLSANLTFIVEFISAIKNIQLLLCTSSYILVL